MSTAKFNTWQNPDGTENYKCRAWVNFNGTGTVAIRAAGNVGSITDNGTGDYTVNFTVAMPDANYTWTHGGGRTGAALNAVTSVVQDDTANTHTTTQLRVKSIYVATGPAKVALDFDSVEIAIFR